MVFVSIYIFFSFHWLARSYSVYYAVKKSVTVSIRVEAHFHCLFIT